MTSTAEPDPQPAFAVAATRHVAAPPEAVWSLVADVTRVGEHSPETVRARWLTGSPAAVGATFEGRNRLGFLTWSTVATVTAADPGRRFAFTTSAPSLTTWTYTFEPAAGGTLVTESMRKEHPQPAPIRWLQRLAGVRDRAAHLEAGMTTTLERLAATVSTPSTLTA
ncbi:SRPBCC family protein [Nocardioides sp.]|uniref:SRPBCC family protein n=1 Tax=Nocardioides sp. TaxID=35761 RepID=UPI00272919BE|nr:SRPBCC family protein [Nocardioides sp.]MDO9457832.1 SRPBCC family protein [Nocardioides sp.]